MQTDNINETYLKSNFYINQIVFFFCSILFKQKKLVQVNFNKFHVHDTYLNIKICVFVREWILRYVSVKFKK